MAGRIGNGEPASVRRSIHACEEADALSLLFLRAVTGEKGNAQFNSASLLNREEPGKSVCSTPSVASIWKLPSPTPTSR